MGGDEHDPDPDDAEYAGGAEETETDDGETGKTREVVTEPEGSAPRTSDWIDNEEAPPPPLTLAELRRRGAANRRIIDANDEEIFYTEMDQARILCLARNPPPSGLGLKGDAYETFSAELGYPGKAGKTLPRLYQPYGERVIAWVQAEQEKAKARGEKFDFPSWREAYAEMQMQWEPRPATRGKNSRGADEELVHPAVEQARLKSEIAARDAKIAAAEAKAKADAEILDQRIKTEVWRREEMEEDLAKAKARIEELEAEVARLRAAMNSPETDPPHPDPQPGDHGPITDTPDAPNADVMAFPQRRASEAERPDAPADEPHKPPVIGSPPCGISEDQPTADTTKYSDLDKLSMRQAAQEKLGACDLETASSMANEIAEWETSQPSMVGLFGKPTEVVTSARAYRYRFVRAVTKLTTEHDAQVESKHLEVCLTIRSAKWWNEHGADSIDQIFAGALRYRKVKHGAANEPGQDEQ